MTPYKDKTRQQRVNEGDKKCTLLNHRDGTTTLRWPKRHSEH
jgi:hypothetical protein